MVENRETAVIEFEVDLSNLELLEIGQKISQLDAEEDKIIVEQRAMSANFKARLNDNNAERKKLSNWVRTKKGMRTGECDVVYDYDAGFVKYKEIASGNIVYSRKMTPEEQQLNLFGGDK